ncbi:MAG TPA: hypothetical protein VFX03_00565, partial [Thermomicrobiales bacterium]|nr:hypothetical protein [Thermomicrobiales bacterium]
MIQTTVIWRSRSRPAPDGREHLGKRQAKAGNDLLAVEGVTDREAPKLPARAMDLRRSRRRINDPHKRHARREIDPNFFRNRSRPIRRRDDLDREIRRNLTESTQLVVRRNVILPNERDIRGEHRIGVTLDDEASIRSGDDSKLALNDVDRQPCADRCCDRAR